jgi:hypothetical protein
MLFMAIFARGTTKERISRGTPYLHSLTDSTDCTGAK